MTNEDRQLKRSIISRIAIITVIAVILGLLVVSTFGWFTLIDKLSSTGMGVVVRKMDYEIIVKREQYMYEYKVDEVTHYSYRDEFKEINDYSHMDMLLNEIDDNEHYDLDEFNTANASDGKVALEIVNEYKADNKYYLRPGAYGTVTFYIRPKTDTLKANFIFECGGYEIVYDEEAGDNVLVEVSDSVKNLLRGHILFFTGRTGATYEEYNYSGLLCDESHDGVFSFSFDSTDPTTYVGDVQSVTVGTGPSETTYNNCYKIVLYWEWPITYDEISEKISTNETTKKYPSELENFYTDNPEYFFVDIDDISDKSRDELNMAYNNGDQNIGAGSDYLVIYLTAS